MDTVYSLEVWVPDGERWRWSAIGAYPTLDMAVAVGEGFLSVKPYRVRRVTDVGDGFHDFLAEEVFANALTGRGSCVRSSAIRGGGRTSQVMMELCVSMFPSILFCSLL